MSMMLALLQGVHAEPDLTANYITLAVLVAVTLTLGYIVVKRRREGDS